MVGEVWLFFNSVVKNFQCTVIGGNKNADELVAGFIIVFKSHKANTVLLTACVQDRLCPRASPSGTTFSSTLKTVLSNKLLGSGAGGFP